MQEDVEYEIIESQLDQLITAVEDENVEEVRALIKQLGGYVNDDMWWVADSVLSMHMAAKVANIEILKLFIEAENVDLNVKSKCDMTALHFAAEEGKNEVLKLLVDSGRVELNAISDLDYEDSTPLDYALKNKNFDGARILIDAGAKYCCKSPLYVAAALCDIGTSFIEYLLSRGEKVNPSYGESTPLHSAAENNNGDSHFFIIKILFENGANANAGDKYCETPFHYLVKKADVKTVELFLDNHAEVNEKNHRGEIPLFAAVKAGNVEVVQLLIDHGSDKDIRNYRGENLMFPAAESGSINVAQLLVNHGSDVNAMNDEGETPLFSAVKVENVEMMQFLLDSGADVNVINLKGGNLLFNAIQREKIEIVQLLLDHGADVNVVNQYKQTVLHVAAYYCENLNVIKCLLKNGADANALDTNKQSPLLDLLNRSSYQSSFEIKLQLFLKYSDLNVIDQNLLEHCRNGRGSKICLEHIAKLEILDFPVNSIILNSIESEAKHRDYFDNCKVELTLAKSTKIKGCWTTFFNILTDSMRKLKNYAGNADLIEEFEKSGCIRKFPIYGSTMQDRMNKGIKRRKLFDQSSVELSFCLPIINPNHLIIRDIFDCLTTQDLVKFCE